MVKGYGKKQKNRVCILEKNAYSFNVERNLIL